MIEMIGAYLGGLPAVPAGAARATRDQATPLPISFTTKSAAEKVERPMVRRHCLCRCVFPLPPRLRQCLSLAALRG